jgi:hypothetical protein
MICEPRWLIPTGGTEAQCRLPLDIVGWAETVRLNIPLRNHSHPDVTPQALDPLVFASCMARVYRTPRRCLSRCARVPASSCRRDLLLRGSRRTLRPVPRAHGPQIGALGYPSRMLHVPSASCRTATTGCGVLSQHRPIRSHRIGGVMSTNSTIAPRSSHPVSSDRRTARRSSGDSP